MTSARILSPTTEPADRPGAGQRATAEPTPGQAPGRGQRTTPQTLALPALPDLLEGARNDLAWALRHFPMTGIEYDRLARRAAQLDAAWRIITEPPEDYDADEI